ncbi:hypothetical protein DD598_27635, partial [Enterobacter cloacae complex sp. 2DZ2F16B1]
MAMKIIYIFQIKDKVSTDLPTYLFRDCYNNNFVMMTPEEVEQTKYQGHSIRDWILRQGPETIPRDEDHEGSFKSNVKRRETTSSRRKLGDTKAS